jgi:AcrR family transcriptional regulator
MSANALVEAAVELAREDGPQAIVLRAAARRVGVAAASAYRHFADYDDLTGAVKVRAQRALADAMKAESVPAHDDAGRQALAVARARRGYLRFAQAEPGLFRAAFNLDAPSSGTSESFALLADALDGQVTSGTMASAPQPGQAVARDSRTFAA